jgi:hypothetical protein
MPLTNAKVVDPNVVQTVSAVLDVDKTIASTTYGVVLSLSVTTLASSNLLIWVSYCMTFTPSVTNEYRLQLRVDGTVVLFSGEEEFGIAQTGSMVHRAVALTAGAHTVDVRWRIGAAGEGTLRCRPSVPPEGISIIAMETLV